MDPILLRDITLVGLTVFVMLVGLFGMLIPVFPGLILIWLAALFYGFIAGFGILGTIIFILITILGLIAAVIDNVFMGAKARQAGASYLALGVGVVAGVAGTIVWPPVGGLLAAPLAILGVEFIRERDFRQALQATKGLILGYGWGFFTRFLIGMLMIALWAVWAVWGAV